MRWGDREWWTGKCLEGPPAVETRRFALADYVNEGNMKAEIWDRNVL
jgi:hypothetical protein